jgi:hypothetical protein
MRTLSQYCFWVGVSLIIIGCEAEENETPPGYMISTLFEVNGKQRVDRTTEVTSCRMEDKWIFDFVSKQVATDYIQGSCSGFTRKNALLHPFDTIYSDSLRGRYLIIKAAPVFGLISPIVHPGFPMELQPNDVSTPTNRLYSLYYRLVKFDNKELIILNHFNPHQIPIDTQYFELKMKYVEE